MIAKITHLLFCFLSRFTCSSEHAIYTRFFRRACPFAINEGKWVTQFPFSLKAKGEMPIKQQAGHNIQ
jgi:hypothetical protein